MDPITAAIVAALAAGLAGAAAEIEKQVASDIYGQLKQLLKKKFGAKSDLAQAVDGLEAKPHSDARKNVLQEEVAATKADQDAELVRVARELLTQLGQHPESEQHIQYASGSNIAQASQGSTASVTSTDWRHP